MTDYASGLREDINEALRYGTLCRIRYFNVGSFTGSYGDIQTLIQSGTDLYCSGLPFPISSNSASEAAMLEQGVVTTDDRIVFLNGLISVSGFFKIGIGSPSTNSEYEPLRVGVNTQNLSNNPVYHKLFVRKLITGSCVGE